MMVVVGVVVVAFPSSNISSNVLLVDTERDVDNGVVVTIPFVADVDDDGIGEEQNERERGLDRGDDNDNGDDTKRYGDGDGDDNVEDGVATELAVIITVFSCVVVEFVNISCCVG